MGRFLYFREQGPEMALTADKAYPLIKAPTNAN
jgi:hypothetical protein